MLNYRNCLLAAALLLPTLPAFASTVPGAGAERLVAILVFTLAGGAIGGIGAHFLVKDSTTPLFAFLWPLLAISSFIVFLNQDLDAGNFFAALLMCGIPYLVTFAIAAVPSARRARAFRHQLGAQYISRPNLVPSDVALPQLREILAKEVEAERNGGGQDADLALLCSVQLFGRGLLEDVLRIWAAKTASPALGRKLDARLLCGAGLPATKAFLAAQAGAEAAEALRHLEQREEAGYFAEFSTQAHLDSYRTYFGLEPAQTA